MKVIAMLIPDFSMGGAEKMVAQLSSKIDKTSFEVHIIVLRKKLNNSIEELIEDKVHVHYLNKNYGFNFNTLISCYKLLKRIKPNLIHTHIQSFVYCVPYLLLHNIKMLHTVHNVPEKEAKGFRRFLLKTLIKLKKAIPVGISDTITDQIRNLYSTSNVETVYNPVDESIFYPKLNVKDDKIIHFISIGRLVEQKNYKLLVETFQELLCEINFADLTVLGDGNLKDELLDLIEDKNRNKIHFLGNKSNVADYLRKSDVFILTSIYEGLPMTILEAISVGLPIICTDVGGNKDIVTNNGILVDSNCKNDLILAMKKILDDNLRSELANNSLNNVKKYYLSNISLLYEDLYNKYSN